MSKKKQPIPGKQATKIVKRPVQAQLDLAGEDSRKKLLHVGCGPQHPDNKLPKQFMSGEWREIRFDIDPSVKPDIVGDIMDMQGVPAGSMDALYSSHNLEHVFAYQVQKVLGEFYRVLKPGGEILLTCPDLQAVAFHVAMGRLEAPLYPSPAGKIAALDIFYGLHSALQQGKHYMAHKCGFTAETLGRRLHAAGFREVLVQRDNEYNLWARAVKYAKGDPRQKEEKITLRGNYPFQVVQAPDVVKGKMPDELDLPPRIWKPLGLKKAG